MAWCQGAWRQVSVQRRLRPGASKRALQTGQACNVAPSLRDGRLDTADYAAFGIVSWRHPGERPLPPPAPPVRGSAGVGVGEAAWHPSWARRQGK
jgi:hypothetical protein